MIHLGAKRHRKDRASVKAPYPRGFRQNGARCSACVRPAALRPTPGRAFPKWRAFHAAWTGAVVGQQRYTALHLEGGGFRKMILPPIRISSESTLNPFRGGPRPIPTGLSGGQATQADNGLFILGLDRDNEQQDFRPGRPKFRMNIHASPPPSGCPAFPIDLHDANTLEAFYQCCGNLTRGSEHTGRQVRGMREGQIKSIRSSRA